MLYPVVKKELIGFFSVIMGCFFNCFRVRDDKNNRNQNNLVTKTTLAKTTEPVIPRNCLSSLLQAEEDKEDSRFGTPERYNERKDLKDEARFLKACGTIPQTPVEIKDTPERHEDVSHSREDSEPFRFHSWLPGTSIDKLNIEKQFDQPPTPLKIGEGWAASAESMEHTPTSSTQANEGGSSTDGTSSVRTPTETAVAASEQRINKSVRFKCEDDKDLFSLSPSSETGGLYSKQLASGGVYSVSKPSTYPTPLKLTDEMQTPGTVFPTNFDGMVKERNPRIRSQYVYSALNPVENIPQLKLLEEDQDTFEKAESAIPEAAAESKEAESVILEAEVESGEVSVERELGVESLSTWLKPPMANQEDKKNFGRTSGDRPIIGVVAAHWNEEEEAIQIYPKYWDGKGIPNSTTKYKEDQKVSWHATPFEERLEKALSDESLVTLRKDINPVPPIDFEDTEESDTALSPLQPGPSAKTMLSV